MSTPPQFSRYNVKSPFRLCHNDSQLHVSDIILLIREKQIIDGLNYNAYLCFIYSEFYKYFIFCHFIFFRNFISYLICCILANGMFFTMFETIDLEIFHTSDI